jgi:soluble lytic murein transglycosylase-like protein
VRSARPAADGPARSPRQVESYDKRSPFPNGNVVSLINGLGGLGSGLSAFAGAAEKDALEPARNPLLSSAAQSQESATPAAPAAAPAPSADAPAPTSGGSPKVPGDLLPIYQAASKRTGIPIDVLIAQGKQESNFDPNVVSSTGEIGLHQIQASTARDPGFGLSGIDPATLKDPVVNISFAADYLKAKGGKGLDFNNPASVNAALAAYNGGGDPNYVANVRRYMGAA